jgi:hypothetical protein
LAAALWSPGVAPGGTPGETSAIRECLAGLGGGRIAYQFGRVLTWRSSCPPPPPRPSTS